MKDFHDNQKKIIQNQHIDTENNILKGGEDIPVPVKNAHGNLPDNQADKDETKLTDQSKKKEHQVPPINKADNKHEQVTSGSSEDLNQPIMVDTPSTKTDDSPDVLKSSQLKEGKISDEL